MKRWVLCLLSVTLVLALTAPIAQSTTLLQLTTSAATDRNPTWSADGQYIYFDSNRSGSYCIYRVPAAGGTVEQITFGTMHEIQPVVSPDGTKLAYAVGTNDPTSLWVKPVAGGPATQILAPDDHYNHFPAWSADGATIFFDSKWGSDWNICRVSAAGGLSELIVDVQADARVTASPDGVHLAYSINIGGNFNVFEAPVTDPMTYSQLTFESRNTAPEDYSPDGAKILVASRQVLNRMELFELDRGTGIMTRLTFDAEAFGYDPSNQLAEYSPDGTKVAYMSSRLTGEPNIWVLELGGGPPDPEVILSMADGFGLPGGGPVTLTLNLTSDVTAEALEFVLSDVPEWLTIDSLETVGRAGAMTGAFLDDGTAHVVLYGTSGQTLPAGIGPIVEFSASIDPLASLGDSTLLQLSGVVMAGLTGTSVDVTVEEGVFRFLRLPGDINGDNLVDVGDLVRLVEIIIGAGDPPTPAELTEADCNGDLTFDALDISCLLDLIMGGSSAPGVQLLAADGEAVDFLVNARSAVRGLQFRFAADVSIEGVAAGFHPMVLHWGRAADGSVIALAFDPFGRGWDVGATPSLNLPTAPVEVRAYGEGGRTLPVTLLGRDLEIGKPVAPGLRILAGSPNPFRSSTRISFSLDRAADLDVQIFDLRGALVSSFTEKVAAAGEHAVVWNPRENGRALPVGVYFARLKAGDFAATARLVYLGQ